MAEFAVLFDMDGVLIDSPRLNWQAYNQVLADYGVHVPSSALSRYVGKTIAAQVAMINEEFNTSIDPDEFNQRVQPIREPLFKNIQPEEGVVSLLKELKARGVPMIVATSMPRLLMQARLTAASIYNYFNDFVTEEDVVNHKPDPEVFIKAAQKTDVDNNRCIVIEDAPSGIQAARAGGFKSVAVVTPYVPYEELASADLTVESLLELNCEALLRLASA